MSLKSYFVIPVTLTAVLSIGLESHAADKVIRNRTAGSNFPIASSVEVPSGNTTIYVSGMVPPVLNKDVPLDSVAAFGDTKTQTSGVLDAIQVHLKELGLSLANVVKMQVFLVGDPARGGRMDFAGFMEAYRQYFGSDQQPSLPARSVMQVAGLVNPGWLVEIEVIAVRP